MTAPRLHTTPQTLLFDADDTLWENNIYFEQAIASFISFLDHQVHTPAQVREHLNRIERATIAAHGYGLQSFRHSLTTCFEELSATPLTSAYRETLESFARLIADRAIELIGGVPATLAELATRHRLLLVTKGSDVEQRDKLARSGLQSLFSAVEVLPEKTEAAYRELVLRHGCAPQSTRDTTWMIGNSPKSDINPALAAGLHAVFIPHQHTWILEHETLDPVPAGRHRLTLAAFPDLLSVF